MTHSDDDPDAHAGDAAGHDAAGPENAGAAKAGGDKPSGALSQAGSDRGLSADAAKPKGAALGAPDSGLADLAPFFPRAEANGAAGQDRGRFANLLEFGSNAAFVLCVLGFAFAAGTYFFSGTPGVGPKPALSPQEAERMELERTTQKLAADIGALKTNVEALRAAVAQEQAAGGVRGVEKSLDALKTRLDAVRTETSGQLAELSTKVDRLQRDPAQREVAERLDRIEKLTSSMLPTGSVGPLVKAATQDRNPAAPAKAPPQNAEAPKRPALITSWVVRDVYDGVALVENARGSIEVALGDTIPGAGVVKTIERRGGGWIVITSRGLVDYDHSLPAP